jgi:hypothetical protein
LPLESSSPRTASLGYSYPKMTNGRHLYSPLCLAPPTQTHTHTHTFLSLHQTPQKYIKIYIYIFLFGKVMCHFKTHIKSHRGRNLSLCSRDLDMLVAHNPEEGPEDRGLNSNLTSSTCQIIYLPHPRDSLFCPQIK